MTKTPHEWWKFYTVGSDSASLSIRSGRADKRNGLPFVFAINPKITFIDSYDRVARIKFAHAHQTQIGQGRLTVPVWPGQLGVLWNVLRAVKGYVDHSVLP